MKNKMFAVRLFAILLSSLLLMSGCGSLWADAASFNPAPVHIAAQSGGGVPVGTIVTWPVAANPADAASWLECNGQSTDAYPELAAVIGATVPDLRGRFLRGFGGNSAALGALQGDAIRNITGNITSTGNEPIFAADRNDLQTAHGTFAVTPEREFERGAISERGAGFGGFSFDASRAVPQPTKTAR